MANENASIDIIHKGVAYGSVANMLLNNNMNPGALRNNATLLKDEWKLLDDAVVKIARKRLIGVADLTSRGLVLNIPNGMGTTVLETENQSDMEDAQVSMDARTRGQADKVEFDIGYLPLPIIHKDFYINARTLQASRTKGQPLDTSMAELAALKVAEQAENLLFTGGDALKYGSGTIFGYQTHTHRNTVTLTTNWDGSAMTGALILDDVIAMKQASITASHFGPWVLYVPTGYDALLDGDYSATQPGITIYDRIKKIQGIEDVKVSDYLTAHNVILVQMTSDCARMIIGMQPTTLEWKTEGGMVFHFKVMTIMVPQIRADQDNKSGIIHLS